MAEYIPDPADVELVRNAWRNAPCPTCHRQRRCRCIIEDHDLRDYRARAVLSALADAGRLRAEANAPGGVFCADEAEMYAALDAIPPADAERDAVRQVIDAARALDEALRGLTLTVGVRRRSADLADALAAFDAPPAEQLRQETTP